MIARALAVAALLAAAAPVRADDASAAKELYERGVRHFNLGEYDAALDAFQAAYTTDRPEILFNIAQCLRKMKRYEAAADAYKAFLANPPPGADLEGARRMAHEMEEAAAARAPGPPAISGPVGPGNTPLIAHREPPRRSSLRIAGIGLTGLGAGLLAAGAVFAGVSSAAGEDAWHRDVYDYAADQRREGFRTGAIASFAVGGVLAAGGVTLWVLGRRR